MLIVGYNNGQTVTNTRQSKMRLGGWVLTVVEVGIHKGVSFELLIVEHLVCCAEVSFNEVLLGGTMAEEEVVSSSFFQVDYYLS